MRMNSSDHRGDVDMSKKCTSLKFNYLTIRNRRKRFSPNERRRADLQKEASKFSIFAWGLRHDLPKLFFFDF